MTDSQLRDDVRDVVSEIIMEPLARADDDRVLAESHPRFDSLAVLDTVGVVEQRFDVSIDLVEDDLRRTFASVASIAELVEQKQADDAALRGADWAEEPR